MSPQHSVNSRCTTADRISDIRQVISADDRAGKMGRIWLRNVIRISLQRMGNKRNPGENCPYRLILKEVPSSSSAKQNEPNPNPEESTARKISHIEID